MKSTESAAAVIESGEKNLTTFYQKVRNFSGELCQSLEPEDFVVQSMSEASPVKWHLAHTTWFFETFVLGEFGSRNPSVVPEYSYLFNSYYNAAGPMHCRDRRGLISRPTVAETLDYRRRIDDEMLDLLSNTGRDDVLAERLRSLVFLGLNHEQQHQELLLTDIKHLFAQNPLYPVYDGRRGDAGADSAEGRWIPFDAGVYSVGNDGNGFCYDNECPEHREFLEPYELFSRLVTNREYREFIEDGGYRRSELWLSLGWNTVRESEWQAPLYWENNDGEWFYYTLAGLRSVEDDEPVCHVSFFEADAYARWAGARLATEGEWEIAAHNCEPAEGRFVEDRRYHPAPAGSSGGRSLLQQMYGDVWEWTGSSYRPYPGYHPPSGALGEYNGKFMCNQMVLRGGSCATSGDHIRPTYRNFFQPDKRWQFSGVRLAREQS